MNVKIEFDEMFGVPEGLGGDLVNDKLHSLEINGVKIDNLKLMSQRIDFSKYNSIQLGKRTNGLRGTCSLILEFHQIPIAK